MADTAVHAPPQTPSRRKIQPSTGSPIGTRKTPIKKAPPPPRSVISDQYTEEEPQGGEVSEGGVQDSVGKGASQASQGAKEATSEINGAVEENVEGEEGEGEEAEGGEGAGEAEEGGGDEEGEGDEKAEGAEEAEEGGASEVVPVGSVGDDGNIVDDKGKVIGKVSEGGSPPPVGSLVDEEGDVLDKEGNVIGKAKPLEEAAEAAGDSKPDLGEVTKDVDAKKSEIDKAAGDVDAKKSEIGDATGDVDVEKPKLEGPFKIEESGEIKDAAGKVVGKLEGGMQKELAGKEVKEIDADGNLLGDDGKILGKVELAKEQLEKLSDLKETAAADLPEGEVPEGQLPDLSILKGKKVNKLGNVVDENGNPFGKLVEGDAKKLVGKTVDAEGKIWNDAGKVIGRAEPIPESDREPVSIAPFEDFPDAIVDKSGKVMFEGKQVGILIEGDAKKLAGKKVDADGDVLDKHGNVLGKAERQDEEEPVEQEEEPVQEVDRSILAGKKVNKAGNVIDDSGAVVGRVVGGEIKHLVGKTVDKDGKIWNDAGKVIGQAELIPEEEREAPSEAPFEDFPNSIVEKSGNVVCDGKIIGRVVEGDAKKLAGKKVDADGDIVDRNGTVLGKAERWEEEEEAPPEAVDMSVLAGKRVNKAGNVVDSHGTLFGRLIEGDVKKLAGKMCDKNGFVRNEGGDIVGKAELVPESEREGMKEGPFADFPGCTVTKDGKVVDKTGEVVGRLTEGDGKKLYGKTVDDDGDVVDRNGNVLGKAERWEEEEVQKDVNPMSGRKVNKEGNVVDENGDIIGKLTEGEIIKCAGKKIDDDGDVIDGKGKVIGHTSLLEDIPAPVEDPKPVEEPTEPEETPEEKEKREQLEQDRKLAGQMATCIESLLDRIRPVLKMITEAIEKAERTPKEELDEQKLVDTVKPLIEEGGRILQEANGVIRGLDPDGRISANAKHKTAAREATPEEYRLADLLKELTGHVTQTIENAKKKIADMPHAKKELNPLWGLLSEPLFQILAAVGLLLSGVLGLVGKLLNGLGLGGLVNNLLGGLGITKVLDGLGLGTILAPITGSKKK